MFKLRFDTDNAAFGNDAWDASLEIARILRKVADDLEHRGFDYQGDSFPVQDANGNKIGKWTIDGKVRA